MWKPSAIPSASKAPSVSLDANLPSSIVRCMPYASPVQALLWQRHPPSAHRPHQHMNHLAMLLSLRLLYHMLASFEPFCLKRQTCVSPSTPTTLTIQISYFAFIYCIIYVIYKSHTSPCASKAALYQPINLPNNFIWSINLTLRSFHMPSASCGSPRSFVKCTLCQPIDTNTYNMQQRNFAIVYSVICVTCKVQALVPKTTLYQPVDLKITCAI